MFSGLILDFALICEGRGSPVSHCWDEVLEIEKPAFYLLSLGKSVIYCMQT